MASHTQPEHYHRGHLRWLTVPTKTTLSRNRMLVWPLSPSSSDTFNPFKSQHCLQSPLQLAGTTPILQLEAPLLQQKFGQGFHCRERARVDRHSPWIQFHRTQMWNLLVCPKDGRGWKTPKDGRHEPGRKAKVPKLSWWVTLCWSDRTTATTNISLDEKKTK